MVDRPRGKAVPDVLFVTPGAPAGYDPGRHNYVKKQLRLIAEGKLQVRPGEAHEIRIAHDEWCRLLAGNGYCDCDPDITVGEEGRRGEGPRSGRG